MEALQGGTAPKPLKTSHPLVTIEYLHAEHI